MPLVSLLVAWRCQHLSVEQETLGSEGPTDDLVKEEWVCSCYMRRSSKKRSRFKSDLKSLHLPTVSGS